MASKRFEFRLERVREMREKAEDEAKEELATALAERERWAQRRDDASRSLVRARLAQRSAAASGGVSIAEMMAHQSFLERTERTEKAVEMDLSRQEQEVAARRSALQIAAQERQVLDKLREKAAAKHRAALERAEASMLDELALNAHRRRGEGL
ncbi:MAG TPA: flagellar export protein FliJ [Solirubrobacteraceae bacterium]|nr:flagellar export protein FliJ [Solirubrobacteraceae bacterium]